MILYHPLQPILIGITYKREVYLHVKFNSYHLKFF